MSKFSKENTITEIVDAETFAESAKIVDALDETTIDAALVKLDGMYLHLDKENRGLQAVHKAVVKQCDEMTAKNARNARILIEYAAQLARAGSYDHKSKNEAILSVVASLLSLSSGMQESDIPEDDIPF